MGVRRFGRLLRALLLVVAVTYVGIAAVDRLWPVETVPVPDTATAIICLGGGVDAPSTLRRSSRLRAERCAELYTQGRAPEIIFTGLTAAPLMADVARDLGVPEGAIRIEDQSRSTLQNALFTARLAPEIMHEGVIIVSNAYHLPRSWASFRVMGFEAPALAASREPRFQPSHLLRETAATWFNAGRLILWWATPWLSDEARDALLI